MMVYLVAPEKSELIKEVIRLARERKNSHDKYSLKSGSMSELMEFHKTDDYQKVKEKKDALDKYLYELDLEDIKLVQTVMYVGRDYNIEEDGEVPSEIFKQKRAELEMSGWNSITIEANQISQKVPLPDYLDKGLSILKFS